MLDCTPSQKNFLNFLPSKNWYSKPVHSIVCYDLYYSRDAITAPRQQQKPVLAEVDGKKTSRDLVTYLYSISIHSKASVCLCTGRS